MAEAPTFLRKQKMPPTPQQIQEDPRVREFLNSYVTSREQTAALAENLENAEREIDKLQGRVGFLNSELQRTIFRRNEYQAGYAELRAQFATVLNAAVASIKAQMQTNQHTLEALAESTRMNLQSVLDVIEAAMREARQRMDDVERPQEDADAPVPQEVEALEDGIKKIAKTFGANARPPDPPDRA